jgi:nucleoside-diphosphate-sugar epimerase
VHRLDAAHLYRLALENASAGGRYHGIADEGVRLRDIAAAIGQGVNVPVVALSPEEAKDHFGWFATFAGLDCPSSNTRTREQLGWHPAQPGLMAGLSGSSYFDA